MWRILFLLPLALLTGCDVGKDNVGLQVDLSHLNWQVGALIALAYFANSKGQIGALATTLKNLLQGLKILPNKTSPEQLTADQVQALILELMGKLSSAPDVQAKLIAIQADIVAGKVAANASGN